LGAQADASKTTSRPALNMIEGLTVQKRYVVFFILKLYWKRRSPDFIHQSGLWNLS
jgi:hypothetical protein